MAYTLLTSYNTKGKNIYGSTLNNYVYGIDIYVEQSNATDNYSNVKTIAWVRCDSGTPTSSTYHFKENNTNYQQVYIKLGVNDNAGNAVKPGVTWYANEKITKYYHNSDGTKTATINFSVETEMSESANANLNNYCFKSASISITITLPTINRLSSASFSGNFTMGTSKAITISSYVPSFTHRVWYAFGAGSGTIAENVTTSCSWTPSRELGREIPNASSGVGAVHVDTYSGGTYLGRTSKQFTLNISADMNPTFTYTHTANNTFNGLLLTSMSTSTFQIQNAGGSYGSTIKSYSIVGEGLNTTNSSGVSSIYASSGTFTYTLKVTDSRGRSTIQTKSVNVYWYEKPVLSITTRRCDQYGTPTDIGNYALVDISHIISNPNNANQMNKHLTIEYKDTRDESYLIFFDGDLENYTSNGTYTSSTIIFESSKSYDFKVTITDSFNSTTVYGSIATSTCIIDIEPSGLGVGKYHQQGAMDIMGDIYVNNKKLYEVGTFTPALYVGPGTSAVYINRIGNYQRIGDYCMFDLHLSAQNFTPGDQNWDLEILDLPFFNRGVYSAVTIGYCLGIAFDGNEDLTACIRTHESKIALSLTDLSTGNTISVRPAYGARFHNSLDIIMSGAYKIET